ncbi:MAG: hypothetical protein ABIY55_10210 [Kofleriaceae bacterium]
MRVLRLARTCRIAAGLSETEANTEILGSSCAPQSDAALAAQNFCEAFRIVQAFQLATTPPRTDDGSPQPTSRILPLLE